MWHPPKSDESGASVSLSTPSQANLVSKAPPGQGFAPFPQYASRSLVLSPSGLVQTIRSLLSCCAQCRVARHPARVLLSLYGSGLNPARTHCWLVLKGSVIFLF